MAINLVKILNSDEPGDFLATAISRQQAKGNGVFWLISGGSAIKVAVEAADKLKGRSFSGKLTVSLTDERYGPLGYPDSNWLQLERAGFSLPDAEMAPILKGSSIERTTKDFNDLLKERLNGGAYRIGLFGVGVDGHTSGILPGSPALDAQDYAVSYDGGQFQRITTTAAAILKLDEAVLYAEGEDKWPMIAMLNDEIDLDKQPAQILKSIPKFTIFTDYGGYIE